MKKIIHLISLLFITQISISQVALNFNGPGDYIQTTYPGVMGSSDRTIEAWVFVDSNAPTANLTISDYGRNTAGDRNTFMVNATRKLAFLSGGGSTGNFSSSATVPIEVWTHVAFVMRSSVGYLYINGVQVGTNSLSSVTTPTGNTNFRIGERISGGTIPFYGSMDEIRVWDVARDTNQLMAYMNTEICTLDPNLKAYYRFNEGIASGTNTAITSCIDYASTNNGSLISFALTAGDSSNYVTGPVLTPGYSKSIYKDSLCSAYTTSSGKVFTTTGVYQDTLTNSVSCDSLVVLDLTFIIVNDSVTKSDSLLTAFETWATFQWVDCNNSYAPISGATSRTFIPTATGNYAVIVSKSPCSDTSECKRVVIITAGLNKLSSDNLFEIFPNPATNIINLKNIENKNITRVTILNVAGKIILNNINVTSNKINIESLENGVYLLKINTTLGISVVKFVKK